VIKKDPVMNTYEFTLSTSTDIHNPKVAVFTVVSTGTNWVEALNKVDPECKMYMVSSKTL
jgi:hypothetical protein